MGRLDGDAAASDDREGHWEGRGCTASGGLFLSLLGWGLVVRRGLQVWTWGHKMVIPRRVKIERDTRKAAGTPPLRFHRQEKLHIVSIAAGFLQSSVVSADGLVFVWASQDPLLKCQQVCIAPPCCLAVRILLCLACMEAWVLRSCERPTPRASVLKTWCLLPVHASLLCVCPFAEFEPLFSSLHAILTACSCRR